MREILSTGGLDNTDFYGIVVHMNANTAAAAAAKLELVKVEDHEGTGECPACGRTGLRWICVMNDGSRAGVECAKKLLGYRPAPKHYNWVPEFTAVAEYVEAGPDVRAVAAQHLGPDPRDPQRHPRRRRRCPSCMAAPRMA
ncbi:hypothetical protein SEA_TRYPO_79 [Mycobacterium phage Trypo]|uniref:Uncharacterized protein n=1 Tax=Mycobacterium phage Trypo TaxID=2099450 RepID=A0A2P1JQ77_9CAUD|nr:hypothetical protein SEA_TRYPO_79 [Mycobacterium phage Trypo]